MIGIDTNVLLRMLVRDDEAQGRAAEHFLETHCSLEEPGFVSRIVIAELAWVLRDIYEYDRHQIANAVRALLDTSALEVDAEREVEAAVKDFQTSPAGFTDCLIARLDETAGCRHTITFDRKAAKLPGFKLLPIA